MKLHIFACTEAIQLWTLAGRTWRVTIFHISEESTVAIETLWEHFIVLGTSCFCWLLNIYQCPGTWHWRVHYTGNSMTTEGPVLGNKDFTPHLHIVRALGPDSKNSVAEVPILIWTMDHLLTVFCFLKEHPNIKWYILRFFNRMSIKFDRLCGLVVTVPCYRSRDPGIYSRLLPDFLSSNGSGTGSTQYNWGAAAPGLENRD
jgi:hypothetical protein